MLNFNLEREYSEAFKLNLLQALYKIMYSLSPVVMQIRAH